jgi:lipopolysaccharide transport system permease protein
MSTITRNGANALEPSAYDAAEAAEPTPPARYVLPEEPLTTIEPSDAWGALNLRDLWASRELLYFLTWRDLKVRYKQTFLGVAWVVLQPLLMTLIFTVVLGYLARVPSDGFPYPLFAYAGLLPWTFFSSGVTTSSNSLVNNSHLITKVYFPRLIVPASAIAARLVDFAVSFVILIPMLVYYRVAPTWQMLALPGVILLLAALSFSSGVLLSALNVRYRDVGFVLPVFIQLWMYVSPVLYPPRFIPAKWRPLYDLNPLVGVIDSFRVALLGGTFNLYALGVSVAATCALLVYALYLFRRVEKSFADLI